MMDWSDRHYRYFMRQISAQARLYTEMITTGALVHGTSGMSPVSIATSFYSLPEIFAASQSSTHNVDVAIGLNVWVGDFVNSGFIGILPAMRVVTIRRHLDRMTRMPWNCRSGFKAISWSLSRPSRSSRPSTASMRSQPIWMNRWKRARRLRSPRSRACRRGEMSALR